MKKGFSLIELIITIAIMTILVGMMSLGLGMLSASSTKSVAYEIDTGLTKLKSMNTAGEQKYYMHVFENDGKYYLSYTKNTAVPALDGSEKELCDASSISIQVAYDEKLSATPTPAPGETESPVAGSVPETTTSPLSTLGSGGDICIGIAKKDGSFVFTEVSGKTIAPAQIQVTSGSGTSYLIYMVTNTGKHHVEVQ